MQIRLPFQDYHDGKAGGGRRLLTAFRLSTNKFCQFVPRDKKVLSLGPAGQENPVSEVDEDY